MSTIGLCEVVWEYEPDVDAQVAALLVVIEGARLIDEAWPLPVTLPNDTVIRVELEALVGTFVLADIM